MNEKTINIKLPVSEQLEIRLTKKLKDMIGTTVEISCPDCGTKFIIRQNSNSLDFFLGCSQYPRCKETREIPETLLMLEAGQASFFDV